MSIYALHPHFFFWAGWFVLVLFIVAAALLLHGWLQSSASRRPPSAGRRGRAPLDSLSASEVRQRYSSCPSQSSSSSDSYARLLSVCFGDRDKAERLIAYELQKMPKLSRSQAY